MPAFTAPGRATARGAAILAAVAVLFTVPAFAQHDHRHGKQLGRVEFPVSCAPEAQRRFGHAMAVLHSFWWEEGDHAFGAVLDADSACAMAHWGLALNAWGNPFAGGPTGATLTHGAEAAARAVAARAPTARERGFIAAAAALYRDAATTSNAARLEAYGEEMARLYRAHPGDIEVAIYHALALVATAPRTDTTFARQRQAAAILNPLFAAHPDHPGLAHYIIHSTDSPRLAHLGLDAARRYARIAPAAPHAQHMPSHIFIRLGLWDEAVASNWASYRAGIDYATKAALPGGATAHELHALDYAVYGYLQRGQDSAAAATVATAGRLDLPADQRVLISEYNGTAMAARIPLERGEWSAAAAFRPSRPTAGGMAQALTSFTRAVGAARSGRPAEARGELAALEALASDFEQRKESYWARVVRITHDAAEAWVRFASGDAAGGLALAKAAADREDVTDKHPVTPAELLPARELEGDMLLAAGRYRDAGAAYRATLAREPGRARSIYGAARAAELAGDRPAAAEGYRALQAMLQPADRPRAELDTARTFLTRAGL
ncbi:MAG TPA: hypothetical protein VMN37_07650, partial [Gemmatimonadales bacterium]|nr:hypothetical protein [Gemmatimonadales bacterium]